MNRFKKFWIRLRLHYGFNRCWVHPEESKAACVPCYLKRQERMRSEAKKFYAKREELIKCLTDKAVKNG